MQKQQDDEGRLGVWAEEEGLLMVVRQMPLRAFERYLASAFLPCLFYIPFFFFLLFVEPFLREDINSNSSIQVRLFYGAYYFLSGHA